MRGARGYAGRGMIGRFATPADASVRLDIGEVTEELGLDEQTSRELAPLLERFNAALEMRQQHWQEGDEILEATADAYDQIAETLSATELREFYWLTRGTAVAPWSRGPVNQYMDGGRMWGGRGFSGRGVPMRGTRGYAGRGIPMRGGRGGMGWNQRPGWRPDYDYPKD